MMKEKFWELFSFSGRVGRLRYFLYSCIAPVLIVLLYALIAVGLGKLEETVNSSVLNITAVIFMLAITIPFLALVFVMPFSFQVRRWHDLNCSGWWVALQLALSFGIAFSGSFIQPDGGTQLAVLFRCVMSLVAIGLALFLLFKRGTVGDNRFGSDPLLK